MYNKYYILFSLAFHRKIILIKNTPFNFLKVNLNKKLGLRT